MSVSTFRAYRMEISRRTDMNRLVVVIAWLLILATGPLVQTAQAVAATDAISLRSSATRPKTFVIAIPQPAECLSVAEWILPNDDNSSGNDHLSTCGLSSQTDFDFGGGIRFLEPSRLASGPVAKPGLFIPLFILFHTWKIAPR